MYSQSHFNDFLSNDQVGKRSAMSKGGQEATSNGGSPMAKPRPPIRAKARPINPVMRSPSREEDSSQSLGYLVNQENADERKEVEIALLETVGDPLQDQKSDILKRVDKRMLQWPLEPVGVRSNSENKVMRENILTPIAQGSLCWVRHNQSFRT